jgi:hypothetical protein
MVISFNNSPKRNINLRHYLPKAPDANNCLVLLTMQFSHENIFLVSGMAETTTFQKYCAATLSIVIRSPADL